MRPPSSLATRRCLSATTSPSARRSHFMVRTINPHSLCSRRNYTPANEAPKPAFAPLESSILSAALRHVPELGFTDRAVVAGARDAGYPEAAASAFAPFALVQYHLVTRRLALRNEVRFATSADGAAPGAAADGDVDARMRTLVLARLRANEAVIERWQDAIALMALPSNVAPSLAELAKLADEIWHLAGDKKVDFSWYTKRAALSAIYSSAELYMTQDRSPRFAETERFVERRLADMHATSGVVGATTEWLAFTGRSFVNVARSKGMRI